MSGLPTAKQVGEWADEIESVGELIANRFGGSEPRQRAIGYVRGLLSSTERKNGWQLAVNRTTGKIAVNMLVSPRHEGWRHAVIVILALSDSVDRNETSQPMTPGARL